ncbi:MAG: EthD family reductase [Salinibacterium sp.]|nr:EthD family reductase [Salinibacterium sp.]
MYRMTILYGQPEPIAGYTVTPHAAIDDFRRYYEETHVPIARRMMGLTGWNLSWIDTPDSPYILIAELYAESAEAMDAILASPEGKAASADLSNFVTGSVLFLTGEESEVALS